MQPPDTSRDTTPPIGTLDLRRPPDTEALRALGRELADAEHEDFAAAGYVVDLHQRACRELFGAAFVIEQLWWAFVEPPQSWPSDG